MTQRQTARGTGWGAATDAISGGTPDASVASETHTASEGPTAGSDFVDDLDVGMALMAALTSRDMGEPVVELNLNALTPAERRAVLTMLQRRLEIGDSAALTRAMIKDDELEPETRDATETKP